MFNAHGLKIHAEEEEPAAPSPPVFSDDPTVAQVLDWHEGNPSRKIHSQVAETERRRIWALLRAALGQQPVSKCRPFQLLNFINSQGDLDSDWTRKRWNSTIQGPFNAADRLQWIVKNPFRGLSFPGGKRGRDWTNEEFWLLLKAAPRVFRNVLLLLRYSGMRPGEGREMENTDVQMEENKILLQKHKMRYRTGKARPIPLHPRLAKFLARLRRRKPPGAKHLLLNSYGRPWTCQAVTKRLRKLRERLGLPDDVKLHGLRHTFITRALMNGVEPAAVQQIAGHLQAATTAGYTHFTNKTDHLNDAMSRGAMGIGGVNKRPKKTRPEPTPLFDLVEPTPLFDLFE